MKKLILLAIVLVSQSTFAQLPWNELSTMYKDLFVIAEQVSDQTSLILTEENEVDRTNLISLQKTTGAVSFTKELDPKVPVEYYKYTLIKSDGTEIPLDKMLTEKVIEKFRSVLIKVKESLKEDRGAEVESILDSL